MSSILYDGLRVEIWGGAGARVSRLAFGSVPPDFVQRPITVGEAAPALLLGRGRELDRVRRAIQARRPIEFHASCGYGKSTLLRHVAANAANDGIAISCVFLQVGQDGPEDLLQHLVGALYTADRPVKPTRDQCTWLLSQVNAVLALDDVALDSRQVDGLLRVLPGCSLVLSSSRPILGRHGHSEALAGLPGDAVLYLIASDLGRSLRNDELPAIRRLAAAVEGQPLHLRQAAALVRSGRWSFQAIAAKAERDPGILDQLSIAALAAEERRALAILALAAGALLPQELVEAMGDIAQIGECLGALHRRGLAVERHDRFGLGVCKAESYRDMLLKDLDVAAALRELVSWLTVRSPTGADSISAAGAALAIVEWAADRGDWPAVARLARVTEPILTLAGRWEASHAVLNRGLQAAKVTGDHAAEALFSHEQGTLAFCRGELASARQLLKHALTLRERHDDQDGASVTRHNLQLMAPAPAPPWRIPAIVAALAIVLVLVTGLVRAATPKPSSPLASTTPPVTASPSGRKSTEAAFHGSGQPPHGGGSSPSEGPLRPPVPHPENFGLVDITPGQTPASVAVMVDNPNSRPLPITSAAVTGNPSFGVTMDNCSAKTIPPHQSCSVTVQFAPTALGGTTGILTIAAPASALATAQLTGTGSAKLTITLTGTGTGSVQDSGGRFSCHESCTEQITTPGQASITLTETDSGGGGGGAGVSVFSGWAGDCSSEDANSCGPLSVTTDTNVTANFDHVAG